MSRHGGHREVGYIAIVEHLLLLNLVDQSAQASSQNDTNLRADGGFADYKVGCLSNLL